MRWGLPILVEVGFTYFEVGSLTLVEVGLFTLVGVGKLTLVEVGFTYLYIG